MYYRQAWRGHTAGWTWLPRYEAPDLFHIIYFSYSIKLPAGNASKGCINRTNIIPSLVYIAITSSGQNVITSLASVNSCASEIVAVSVRRGVFMFLSMGFHRFVMAFFAVAAQCTYVEA